MLSIHIEGGEIMNEKWAYGGYKHSPGIIAYYVDKDIVQELSWVRY